MTEEQMSLLSRRTFMQAGTGAALTLAFSQLAPGQAEVAARKMSAGELAVSYASWEDIYRKTWQWDKVNYGSHSNACLPTGCLFHVYSRNGIIWREEQAAKYPYRGGNYPDTNPMGCQKGCGFSQVLHGSERIKYPLKRAGERGAGKWQRISWDQALTEIADAILDAHQSHGPDSFITDSPHIHSGFVATAGIQRMVRLLGGVMPDINVAASDVYMGLMQTFGKMFTCYTPDNVFDAELFIVTNSNPSYNYIPNYHFYTGARYNGTETIVLSPEYTPHLYADIHVPLRPGSDAAFWLAVCQVLIEERLFEPHSAFVREQTDLPVLVRADTRRYLRESDLHEGGREKGLFFWDTASGRIVPAPRKTLELGAIVPAIDGDYQVTLKNGEAVAVRPVFAILKEHLASYTPEKSQQHSGIHPGVVRELARKIATKRTCVQLGYTSGKSYHGDLAERALLLALGLSANWGKPGTGQVFFSAAGDDGALLPLLDKPIEEGGLLAFAEAKAAFTQQLLAGDPDLTDEDIDRALAVQMGAVMGNVNPAPWMYYHCGYDQLWDRREWLGDGDQRTFGEALAEAVDKGWWKNFQLRPAKDVTPQVLCIIASNPLRKHRGAWKLYREVLFPKLKMIFAIEVKISTTAAFADIILPAAWYYEKHDKSGNFLGHRGPAFLDQAAAPPGEARPEWEIFSALMQKLGERAKSRGLPGFTDTVGIHRTYDQLLNQFTLNGKLGSQEDVVREAINIDTGAGIFPAGTTYEKFKADGWAPHVGLGQTGSEAANANEFDVNKPFFPLRWHVDNKKPYPTYARRAQFYLDHDWFLEAGQALPAFVDVPLVGGDHPFRLTGGHPRHSIHTLQQNNSFMMRLHRGQPVVHLNHEDAAELGIKDGDHVVIYNDLGDCEVMARLSPGVLRGQVLSYMWETNLYKHWQSIDAMQSSFPKSLLWAGGYDQFFYHYYGGGPMPATDRGMRVGVRRAT